MPLELRKVRYSELNARQQENYNYQKLSAVLADYGFVTLRLTDDWQGADLIAQHIDGSTFLRIQLKGRPGFRQVYRGKDLYIAFRSGEQWYLYPHDELLKVTFQAGLIENTKSWVGFGTYHFPSLSQQMLDLLERYRLGGPGSA